MFFIEFSSNEVRRNLQFIHIIPYPNTPTALNICSFSCQFNTARKISVKDGWYKHCDIYLAPKEK